MHKHDHSKTQVKAIANTLSGPTGINAVTAVDNRPEALRQSNLQEMANEGVKKNPAPQPPPVNNGNASAVVQPVLIYKGESFSKKKQIKKNTDAFNLYNQHRNPEGSDESIYAMLTDPDHKYDLEKADLPLIPDANAETSTNNDASSNQDDDAEMNNSDFDEEEFNEEEYDEEEDEGIGEGAGGGASVNVSATAAASGGKNKKPVKIPLSQLGLFTSETLGNQQQKQNFAPTKPIPVVGKGGTHHLGKRFFHDINDESGFILTKAYIIGLIIADNPDSKELDKRNYIDLGIKRQDDRGTGKRTSVQCNIIYRVVQSNKRKSRYLALCFHAGPAL